MIEIIIEKQEMERKYYNARSRIEKGNKRGKKREREREGRKEGRMKNTEVGTKNI